MAALERLKVILAHDEIHADGDPSVAVLVQRECTDDGVRKIFRLENRGQAVQRKLRFGFTHEELPAVGRAFLEPGFGVRREPASSPPFHS